MSRPNRWQEQILQQDNEIKDLKYMLRRALTDMPKSYLEAVAQGRKAERDEQNKTKQSA